MERLPVSQEDISSQPKVGYELQNTELDLLSETDRLKTFANWSVTGLDKDVLAAAGLYYVEKDNLVRCIHCDLKIIDFTSDETLSHKCSQTTSSKNSDLPDTPEHTTNKCDVTPCDADSNSITEIEKNAREMWLEKMGVHTNVAPKFPRYATLEARLKSFETWSSPKQQPSVLSESGFFYMGVEDRTVCFHCGGGLREWKETDDPWIEHAHWFPKCNHVLTAKGKEFVDKAWGRKLDAATPKEMRNPTEALKELIDIVNSKRKNKGKRPVVERNCTLTSDLEKMLDEKESLVTCRICFGEERNVMFSPCRHIVSCSNCAVLLKLCPVCRGVIEKIVRVYHS